MAPNDVMLYALGFDRLPLDLLSPGNHLFNLSLPIITPIDCSFSPLEPFVLLPRHPETRSFSVFYAL